MELVKLYFLHKHIAAIIKNGKYDLIFINPSKFTQAPFILRFLKNTVYFCQETLRIVYDNALNSTQSLPLPKKIYEKNNRTIRKWIDKDNILKAKIILVNSKYSKINIKKAYGKNAHVCYLGVDTKKFIPINLKKEHDLLFIGEKVGVEGYDLLKEMLALYRDKPSIKIITRTRSGKGISQDNLIKEYNKAKIVLSLSKNEPFGLIPIEAMSCGVAVIAVSEGGLKESIVNGQTGYAINRDPLELRRKIDLLLRDENLRNKMGQNGRVHVENNFTWKKSVNNFLKIVGKSKN